LSVLARRLGISPSYTSEIISGKRPLPARQLEAMSAALDLDLEEKDQIAREILMREGVKPDPSILEADTPRTNKKPRAGWEKVAKDLFWVLEDWHYLPLLDATLLRSYDGSLEFLARSLGLSLAETTRAVERLTAAGLLREKNGK